MKTKKVTIGDCTLYCGDAFDILPKLDVKVDAVISDPPYGSTDCDWDVKIPLDSFWTMVEERVKPSASYVLFGCGKFSANLINSMYRWYRYDLIWVKSKKCGFLNANLQPMRNHESIHVFIRPGFFRKAIYNPQKTPGGKAGIKRRNHKSSVYRDTGEYTHVSDGTRHPSSVLYFKSESGQHPTQKPVDLMEWLVRTYSHEGNIVLDPFAGSGSTGIACVNTDRAFVGIEQDPDFFHIACNRIERAYEKRKEH